MVRTDDLDSTVTLLHRFWAEALDLERIDPEDDFLELGGYSLLAMRITAQVNEAFDIDIPMALLFRYPTLAQFAAAVDAAVREQAMFAGPGHHPE